MDISKVCRSCMKEVDSYEVENFDQRIIEMFTFCTNIEVTKEDNMPRQFCYDCTITIQSSYMYINNAQEVNVTLINVISKNASDVALVDSKDFQLEESNVKINYSNDPFYILNESSNCNDDFIAQYEDNKLLVETGFGEVNKNDEDSLEVTEENAVLSAHYKGDCINNSSDTEHNSCNTRKSPKVFKDMCGYSEKKKLSKKKSKKSIKTGILKQMCQKCKKTFKSKMWFLKHMKTHNDEEIALNTPCLVVEEREENSYFKRVSPKLVKSNNKNAIKSKYACEICTKTFQSINRFIRHVKTHSDAKKNVLDSMCVEISEKDEMNVDATEKEACPICGRTFLSKLWLSRHIEAHAESKTYFCPYCPQSFQIYDRFIYHKKCHAEDRQFGCDTCGKRFSKRKRLATHLLCHGGARPYACQHCDMRFKTKGILSNHMKVHDNERPFLCYICGSDFRKAGTLKEHIRRHTGERPYPCALCPFRAHSASSLLQHQRRHRGERPHACHHCHKRFTESGKLARHMRTHTGERPYRCPQCALSFLDSWKRKMHLMRAHSVALEDIPRMARDGSLATVQPKHLDL